MFQKNKTENYTWVTLLATDDYVSGVIGLNYSLLKVKSKYPLLVLAVDTLKKSTFQLLETENIKYIKVPFLKYNKKQDNHNYNLTINKFYIFSLTQYKKVCYLDADVIVIKNCDDIVFSQKGKIVCANYNHMLEKRVDSVDPNRIWKYNGMIILAQPNMKLFTNILNNHLNDSDDEDTLSKLKRIKSFNKIIYNKLVHYGSADTKKYWHNFKTIENIVYHVNQIQETLNNESHSC